MLPGGETFMEQFISKPFHRRHESIDEASESGDERLSSSNPQSKRLPQPTKKTLTFALLSLVYICMYAYIHILRRMVLTPDRLSPLHEGEIGGVMLGRSKKDTENNVDGLQQKHRQKQSRAKDDQNYVVVEWGQMDVVHIVYTRFMQHQGNLLHLGKARIRLFKTFCLPSMVGQSNGNFLWVIRTDPELHDSLRKELSNLLSPYSNFLLVSSNSVADGWRKEGQVKDVLNPRNIVTGNVTLARFLHNAAQTQIVLETRLDADDGLHVEFIDRLQRSAKEHFFHPNVMDAESEPLWLYWCASHHYEWHPTPVNLVDNAGVQEENDREQVRPKAIQGAGKLIITKERMCITPGLTKGYAPGTSPSKIPNKPHHKLHKLIKRCSDEHDVGCLRRMSELNPSAIRSRTATSAGMKGVQGGGGNTLWNGTSPESTKWLDVWEKFKVRYDEASKAEMYLTQHVAGIATDNLKGQCTKGHSCKPSSKETLLKLIQKGDGAALPLQVLDTKRNETKST